MPFQHGGVLSTGMVACQQVMLSSLQSCPVDTHIPCQQDKLSCQHDTYLFNMTHHVDRTMCPVDRSHFLYTGKGTCPHDQLMSTRTCMSTWAALSSETDMWTWPCGMFTETQHVRTMCPVERSLFLYNRNMDLSTTLALVHTVDTRTGILIWPSLSTGSVRPVHRNISCTQSWPVCDTVVSWYSVMSTGLAGCWPC